MRSHLQLLFLVALIATVASGCVCHMPAMAETDAHDPISEMPITTTVPEESR